MGKIVNGSENQKSKKRKTAVAFWNKHRKTILITTSVVGTTLLTIISVKSYRNATAFDRWLKKASLGDLKSLRENILSEYMNPEVSDEYRQSLWNLSLFIDKKISEIAWGGKTPTGPSYHPEHGCLLYKPD